MIRFLFAVLFLVACAPRLEYGERCARNSDCPAPYACLVGRCTEECRTQADCTYPGRCVSVLGVPRCFYDDRASDACTAAADCGDDPALVCRAGGCYNGCERCAELGAVCEGDVCVRLETRDAGPADDAPADAGTADAGRDGGGAPVFAPHQPCTGSEECAGGLCVSDDGATPVCRVPCTGPAADAGTPGPDDPECESRLCVRPHGSDTEAYCALTCDPLDPSSCPAGETCDLVERSRPTTAEPRRVWGCRPVRSPTLAVDEPCPFGAPEYCPAGTHCRYDGPSTYCLAFCDVTSVTCMDGRSCDVLHSDDEAYPVGTCGLPSMM